MKASDWKLGNVTSEEIIAQGDKKGSKIKVALIPMPEIKRTGTDINPTVQLTYFRQGKPCVMTLSPCDKGVEQLTGNGAKGYTNCYIQPSMTQNEWVEYVEGWFKLVKTKLFPSHSSSPPVGDAESQQLVNKMLTDEENRQELSKSIPDDSARLTTRQYDNISTITKRSDELQPIVDKTTEKHVNDIETHVKPIEKSMGYGGSTKRRRRKRKRSTRRRRSTKKRSTIRRKRSTERRR